MGNARKDLLAEIDRKIARKKEMAAKAAERNTIDSFVLTFIRNIEDLNNMTFNSYSEWHSLVYQAKDSMLRQLRTYDPRCEIEVSWIKPEDIEELEKPGHQVNGVIIKWSGSYQTKHSVSPELFIDATCLLFKDFNI